MDTPEHADGDVHSAQEGESSPRLVRTSRLAVVACVLAVISLLLQPGLIPVSRRSTPQPIREIYQLVTLGVAICAVVFGGVGLSRIGLSRGRLTGKAFAWVGVAIPVVLWLLFLVMILLARPGSTAFRMTCGANLSGIGKGILIYANDYEGQLPRAGGLNSQWTGRVVDWTAPSRYQAYGVSYNGAGGQVSVSASLYLLVKYAEVPPERFLCGGTHRKTRERGITEFKAGMYRVADRAAELIDFWDFGPNPPKHCSYAYHMVYGPSRLTVYAPAGFAVAGDRNPWMDSPSARAGYFSGFVPDIPPYNGASAQAKAGNSFRHQGEGQNVLFLDTHVDFQKRPFCGLDEDNIYTSWDSQDRVRGVPPKLGSMPADTKDSLLVNDPVSPSR